MVSDRDRLVAWLNDAYAMEKALTKVLERHVKDAEGNTEVHERVARHLDDTRNHAAVVKSCIEGVGGSPSAAKAAFATLFGAGQGMLNKPLKDTLVKNAISDYAAEHFEIACYRALIVAADNLGEHAIATQLGGILDQELAMAQFLEEQLPHAVREQLGEMPGACQ